MIVVVSILFKFISTFYKHNYRVSKKRIVLERMSSNFLSFSASSRGPFAKKNERKCLNKLNIIALHECHKYLIIHIPRRYYACRPCHRFHDMPNFNFMTCECTNWAMRCKMHDSFPRFYRTKYTMNYSFVSHALNGFAL